MGGPSGRPLCFEQSGRSVERLLSAAFRRFRELASAGLYRDLEFVIPTERLQPRAEGSAGPIRGAVGIDKETADPSTRSRPTRNRGGSERRAGASLRMTE